MLAHYFVRVKREGDWILQQPCLERMLPYFFVAGHHHYARYISWHLRDMQHIPLDASLMVHTLPSHRQSCCGVWGSVPYGEQTHITQGKTSRGTEGHIDQP